MNPSPLDVLHDHAHVARLADVRLGNAIAAAVLDGASQAAVAEAVGISQPAVSQRLRGRRERTTGPYWTIPVLAGRLTSPVPMSNSDLLRCCAQFSADFRRIVDPVDQEAALGAPETTKRQNVDCLVAAIADFEAHRAGLDTPAWAVGPRYDMFPSWFITSSEGLTAWLLRVTPPEFSVRGVYVDPRDLESV